MTAKAVVTLCVAYDERYKGVEHYGMNCCIVPQIPSETMLLQPQKTGFSEDKLDLHVGLRRVKVAQLTSSLGQGSGSLTRATPFGKSLGVFKIKSISASAGR